MSRYTTQSPIYTTHTNEGLKLFLVMYLVLSGEWVALDQVVIRNTVASMRRHYVQLCDNRGVTKHIYI